MAWSIGLVGYRRSRSTSSFSRGSSSRASASPSPTSQFFCSLAISRHLGDLSLVAVIFVALVGKVAASCIAWWIGRRLDLERIKRPADRPSSGIARWLYYAHPTEKIARQTESFFARRGAWSVFLGRLVPVVRSFISYPAGATRHALRHVSARHHGWLAALDRRLDGAWRGRWHSYRALEGPWRTISLWIIIAMFLAAAGYWLWRRLRKRRRISNAERATQE